jgi:lipoprotein-anchoring transpeptidase ErfK/SrfK
MKRVAVSFARIGLWQRAVVSLALVLFAAVAVAPAAGPPRAIGRGVTIAGLNAAGLDAGQARQLIRRTFGAPVRFRLGHRRWTASTSRLGADLAVDDAVSRALRAGGGEDVHVDVAVDKNRVRRYVAALNERFGIPARDARLVGLVHGRPSISKSSWGRAVRRGTMTAAITRMLRKRVRPRLTLVMRPLKPTVTRATFGPVIVIRRDSKRLDLYDSRRYVRQFPVATGRAEYPTPTGTWRIVDMQRNPWWRPPDSDWARGLKPIPPGPGNPLGTRWMGLSAPGVGIHGTPDAASVGYSASHGCIRMFISDATWLFDHVRIGTPVVIVAA